MATPSDQQIQILLTQIDALLAEATRLRYVEPRREDGLLKRLVVSADNRSARAQDPLSFCQVTLSFSQDATPHLAVTGSCWHATRDSSVCEHAAALLHALRRDAIRRNPQPQVVELLSLMIPPKPDDVLARVDQLITRHVPPAASQQWLAWRVEVENGTLIVLPLIRSQLKNGKPGRGRLLARNVGTDLRPFVRTEQDAAVLALTEAEGGQHVGYGRGPRALPVAQLPPLRLLMLLAGHPEVEWHEDNSPIRIENATPGLGIVEREGTCSVTLCLGGRDVGEAAQLFTWAEGAAAWWPAERLISVGQWSAVAGAAIREITQARIRVPSALGAALVQKLAPLQKTVALTLPPSLQGRSVDPDVRPMLICEPREPAGAVVRVVVRPLAGGPQVTPGVGDRELSAFVGDERLCTTRDFATEIDRARAIAMGLGLSEEGWTFALDSDEQVLEFVERLRDPQWAELSVEWPARPQLLSQSVRSMRVQIGSQEDWFGVDGEAEVDGATIVLADVLNAVRLGKRFVALGQGRFVELERAFRDRMERLADVVHEGRRGLQLSAVAVPLADEALAGVDVVVPLEWTKLVRRAEEARHTVPLLPRGLQATLRDYQVEGFRWLWRLAAMGVGGCLADDMGLGKTVQTIAMLVERAPGGPQLVVTPTSVGFNWMRELNRFAPGLRVHDFREGDRDSICKAAGPGDVVIVSYGLLRSSGESLQQVTWKTLVLDEAQAFKNYETDTARAVRAVKAEWKLALTGTPLENHLGELYSLMQTICPGLLGTWQQFVGSFAKPIEKEHSAERRAALARLLRPFILRRTKTEVLKELPARTEIRLDATLSKQERSLYEQTRLATLAALEKPDEDIDARFIVLSALTRLRQLASHARMVEASAPEVSAKQAVLMEQLDEILSEGHTALVFSQFTTQLRLIEKALSAKGIRTLYLDGGTPAAARRKLVDRFQQGEAQVFLVSLKAGGSGLNLTAADYVFLLDPWWNPAVEDQAADRAHRLGQQRPVTVVRIVATGTVEEKVLSLHAQKRQLVAGVLDGADVAARLSADELIDLLREGQRAPREFQVG